MHVVGRGDAMVVTKEELDPAVVEKEREIFTAAAKKEGAGKPDNIIAKMVDGRLRQSFAKWVLLEQPFVKDETQTVGQVAKNAGMTVRRFVRWQLGKE